MNTRPLISALAITKNEAQVLEGFLKQLDFANEIIIVDSFSTDGTQNIVRNHPNAQLIERPFKNFSDQKNFAIEQATHPWIVFFDPDEEITPALKEEILAKVSQPEAVAYRVKRALYFMGKRLRYSGFQNDYVIRLFRKDKCRYDGSLVHETIKAQGKVATFSEILPHHTYRGFDQYTSKLHQYSKLKAMMMFQKHKKARWIHFIVRPWYRFWHQYIIRLGILDGKEGFVLAYLNAFTVFKRYIHLWLLYRKIE
ncbi:MAG: glycosyl transferase family 2 [Flavobacteriaceae bacterium]|nr:glycosyl transferase family 2 [Flavobacteriaceae bacterium]